jgi:DNA mismatch repair ATPase MutS
VDLEETVINIEKGRHPVIPLLFSADDQFVANDTKLKVGPKFSEFEVYLYLKQSNFVKVLL